tara:strand:- start:292 stop:594 length:303 start_codon:yes stop_codon:yes gene_type:complete
MGAYVCESKRIHVVYGYFDVCLCYHGFEKLRKDVNKLSSNGATACTLRFACASISVRAEDLLPFREILDEAMDRLMALGLELASSSSNEDVFAHPFSSLN